jgi:peptide deformylase
MSIQPIRLFGDPALRMPAQPVVDFDKELRTLVNDLTETMLEAPGVGLAAPQIGVSLRVFTYDVDDVVGHLINPQLDLTDEEQFGEEGCLSLPNLTFDCRDRRHRPASAMRST